MLIIELMSDSSELSEWEKSMLGLRISGNSEMLILIGRVNLSLGSVNACVT